MSMRQIIVLVAAGIAALLALLLLRGVGAREAPAKADTPPPIVGVEVLVAAKPLQAGVAASAGDLAWAAFPKTSVTEAFITKTQAPQALEEMSGAVARYPLEKGEPVTAAKLVKRGEGGFMAAMLEPGFRAVATPIEAETAAAGFILPNDRVDVLMTRKVQLQGLNGARDEVRSNVVLEDIRVLAIDQKAKGPAGDPEGPAHLVGAVATLELSPRDAATLAMADEMGDISLSLRSLERAAGGPEMGAARRARSGVMEQNAALAAIKFHAYGAMKTDTLQSPGND